MKFSTNWLRDFVEVPARVEELARLLTFAGVEIDAIEQRGTDILNVVIGQINASAQHPNADRLSVCDVDDGTDHHRQIVCGAKNYKVGDKVPVALPGAALPNGLKIKASKLRGVESQGMLCSPSELKLSDESGGLLILPHDAEIGAPLATLYPADTILGVEITPNRADLLSHFGLAREIAALTGKVAKEPVPEQTVQTAAASGVKITAANECPFYSARRINGVTVAPSPAWLRAKIEAVGLRAVNNIVDITNFVMHELGQPLHAFDADKLAGGIDVRLALFGEKFLALDGIEYELSERDLMIADAERAVAIGGVMGGEDTGVTESTRNVLLEAAYFSPSTIRRTARTLNLPSDASYRFERGVDPAMILLASQRAAGLIREIADGSPAAEIAIAGAQPDCTGRVTLRYDRCNRLLGAAIEPHKVSAILGSFGLRRIREDLAGASTWEIPTFRADLQQEVDLIEEVVRAYGIERIPSRQRSRFTPESDAGRTADSINLLRERLVALGLFEARTSALISRADAARSDACAVSLKNPLSEDHVALRPSLVPGLLGVLGRNQNMGARSIRVFETGRIFLPPDALEQRALAIILSGSAAYAPHWRGKEKRQLDLFDVKRAVEALRLPRLVFRRGKHHDFALSAEIMHGGAVIGVAGQLSAARAGEIGANSLVFVAEINLDGMLDAGARAPRFAEIEKYPPVSRDIAMLVPEVVTHAEVAATIAGAEEPLLVDVQLFDLFTAEEGSSVAAGKKSLAYTLTYRDRNRTLTNDEVTVVHDRIRERIKRELGAELRE